MIGISYQVKAQEEESEESFWTEESTDGESASSTSSEPSNKPKVKPVSNSCSNKTELREEVRLLIRPYKYNLSKTTIINFKRYPQLLRVLIPIYSDQEHRLIFSTKGLPQDIGITIYDRPKNEKRRKVLYTSNSGEPINTFELPEEYKEPYLFVEYSVPPSEAEDRNTTIRGCAIMMMGYLYLPKTEGESTVDTDDGKKKKK
jgi:hypothetical protein